MDFMKAHRPGTTIAVIGGGFCGTMVAVHLARNAGARPPRILLFEKADRFARGVAYGTLCDGHLLNVPASHMSAFPDEPGHFFEWLRNRDASVHHGTFAPRKIYGEYLADNLEAAKKISAGRLELIREEVVDLKTSGVSTLTTDQGIEHTVDRVVLALGHFPPRDPFAVAEPARFRTYFPNPWACEALADLPPDAPIAFIGTGLTAVDLIVEARSKGHRGPIHAISRHGLFPCRHGSSPVISRPHFSIPDAGKGPTVRSIVRQVRSEAVTCQEEGGDWRSVVDSLRPVTQTLWQSMETRERQRFVRHIASRWEVHRHRVAPLVDDKLQAAMFSGQLVAIAGRISSVEQLDSRAVVTLTHRGSDQEERLEYARVINCTGPSRDVREVNSPLLKSLLASGDARPGPLGLGLDVGDDGALIREDGNPHTALFSIGPLLRENLWETTAVRELRVQAKELAARMADEPSGHFSPQRRITTAACP